MSRVEDGVSTEIEDAIVTRLGQRLAETGHLDGVMAELSHDERRLVEDAWERHGDRRRAAGEPGW